MPNQFNENSTQGANRLNDNIFIAAVLVCLPDVGQAIVIPATQDVTESANPIPATLPYADSNFGCTKFEMYPAGTAVVCVGSISSDTYIVHIIGALNIALDFRNISVQTIKPYNAESWTQSSSTAKAQWKVLEKLCSDGTHTWVRTRAQGASSDALPGDFDITDRRGFNGLHIGRLVSQLRGGPMSFVDANALTNTVRIVGDKIEEHTLTYESVISPGYKVSNTAININEAFGVMSRGSEDKNSGILNQDSTTKKISYSLPSTTLPFYRIQHMEGRSIDGVEDVILGTKESNDGKTIYHSAKNEPYVLSNLARTLDGRIRFDSADSIVSWKGPDVSATMQAVYNGDASSQDDLREGRKYTNNGFSKSKYKLADDMAKNNKNQSKLQRCGITAKKEYSLDGVDAITLKDPVTGQTKTYYATYSCIRQDSDGSVHISDDCGSEIIMKDGNIYISPALDCYIRPGRDMSVMAGRHQSYNSQQTCTINSTTGMYIRAEDDLLMTGATSGKGKLLIECRNKENSNVTGLMIHSLGDLSLVSDRMFVVDADDGLILRGSDIYIEGNHITEHAHNDVYMITDASAILLGSGTVIGGSLSITGTTEIGSSVQYSVKMPAFGPSTDGKLESMTRTFGGGDANLTVRGATKIYSNVDVGGKIHAEGNIETASMFVGELDATFDADFTTNDDGEITDIEVTPSYTQVTKNPNAYSRPETAKKELTNAKFVFDASKTLYQENAITLNVFKFPSSSEYGRTQTYYEPEMEWQENDRLTEKASYSTWVEKSVNQTACYPGYWSWTNDKVARTIYSDTGVIKGKNYTSILSGYIVNAKIPEKKNDNKK